LVQTVSHAVGDEQRAVLLEESLMIAEMIGVDLEVVAEVWDARGTGDFSYGISVDGNCYRFVFLEDIRYRGESSIVVDKSDT
jgi:hypothetical protein